MRATKEIELAGHRQLSLFVDAPELFAFYFQTNPADFIGTLSLEAADEKTTAAVGLIQKRQSGALIAVPTSPYSKSRYPSSSPLVVYPSLLFPQFANGQSAGVPNRTRVILKDVSPWPVSGKVKFQDPKGNPTEVPIKDQNKSP